MIKSSGYRISPTEVEEVLMATGRVPPDRGDRSARPLGRPTVHAVAVARAEPADVRGALTAAISEQLAAFMVPRMIELVDGLPSTPNGKVDYKALVRQRANHAGHLTLPRGRLRRLSSPNISPFAAADLVIGGITMRGVGGALRHTAVHL